MIIQKTSEDLGVSQTKRKVVLNNIVALESTRQASHCQRKVVIRRWINVLFQKAKVLSKHTFATSSYCIDGVNNIRHVLSEKYRAIIWIYRGIPHYRGIIWIYREINPKKKKVACPLWVIVEKWHHRTSSLPLIRFPLTIAFESVKFTRNRWLT